MSLSCGLHKLIRVNAFIFYQLGVTAKEKLLIFLWETEGWVAGSQTWVSQIT